VRVLEGNDNFGHVHERMPFLQEVCRFLRERGRA